ncbi:MAG TPA: CoA transferase [Actinocrinis sp.]|nr:CoA transferase [Actinocrinis sp.]
MTARPGDATATPVPGPLDGVVVADFSRVLAGPYATMLLADLGATVVKVERPDGGDETRAWGPPWSGGLSTYFQAVNRNKLSMVCDLSSADGRAAALDLCRRADVVVENFRTGTMDRLGLGAHQVRAANPRAVYCSITGFGSGAGADLPGYDFLIQAVGGLMSITGPDAGAVGGPERGGVGDPTKTGVAVVDVITGLHALVGILAALRHRDATGNGQLVEVNLLTSLLSGLVNQVSGYLNAGVVPYALGNGHPSIAPYELVQAQDRPLALAVGNDRQFAALCAELGLNRLADDPRFATNAARVEHRGELVALLNQALAGAPADHWAERLMARAVPCGPVNTIDQAVRLAERLGLEPCVDIHDGESADHGDGGSEGRISRQIRHPISFSVTAPRYALPPQTWERVQRLEDVLPLLPPRA